MNYTSQSSIAPTGNKTAIASSSSTYSGSGAAHILALTPLVNNTFDPANYSYNEQLSITTGPTGPDKRYNGYTVRLASFNTQSLISAGKLQPDCDDLRVVHDSNGTLAEVDRHLISCNASSSDIRFMLQTDIADSTTDTNYYLYYGNPSANAPNPVTTTNVYRWYDDASIDRSGDYTHGRIDAWHGSGWDDSLSWDSAGYYSYNNGENHTSGYRIAVDERDALIEAEFYHTGCYPNNMTTGVLLRGQIDSGSNGSESSSHYYVANRGHNANCGSGYNQDGDILKSYRTTTAVNGTNPATITNNQWRKMALSVWGINSTTLNFWDNNSGWPTLAWPDAGSLHISGTDSDYDGRGFAAIMTAQDKARVRNIVVRRYVESEPVVSIISSTAVDHYAITYPLGNPGITCEANAFTVTAHDANHLVIAPTSSTQITIGASMLVDGITLKSGNGTFTAPDKYTFDGTETSAQFWLRRSTITASPHIDIDINDGTATDNDGDAGEDVNAQYVDTGFRFFDDTTGSTESINHQIAGKPSNTQPNSQTLQLRAVKTNSTTQACEVALQGTTAVELAYECNNPSTCINNDLVQISAAENKFIARNNNAGVSSYTSVNMSFDTNGIAPFSFYYNDAGNITLYARKILSTDNTKTPPTTAATLLGASNQFNVRPFGFYMNNLSTATDATSGNIFAKAGNDFTTSLTAKTWASGEDANVDGIPDDHDALSNNLTTENFGHEASSQAVSLTHSKISPTGSGTNTGILGGNTAQTAGGGSSDFNAGVASNVTLNWNEVGIISLTATLSNYLSSGLTTTSTTNNIGRFIPHHFDINANTPDFANSCTLFTYLGQNFYYGTAPALTVTAQAKLNSTTVNYGGGLGGTNGYWKLNSFLTRSFSEGSPSAPSATLSVSTAGVITLSGETDFDGSGTISQASGSSGDEFTYSKNGVELPFDADVDIIYSAATLTDSDGSCYDPDNNLSCDPYSIEISNNTSVSTELRYGRMVLFDAYGSELNPLKLPLTLEYWQSVDGNNTYTLASDDTCTSLSSSDVIFSDYSGNLSSGETNVISPITLTSGKGNLTLSAPGNNNGGSVCVEYDLVSSNQSWLQDTWSCSSKSSSNPLGKAQFGIFPGNSRQIYMREQY
ncbi:MAG: hypothetical protein GY829_14545 [Gammaproteobacteria bacterium]|nr:hypothetical protein [Gammaproteobacteria bacterium]